MNSRIRTLAIALSALALAAGSVPAGAQGYHGGYHGGGYYHGGGGYYHGGGWGPGRYWGGVGLGLGLGLALDAPLYGGYGYGGYYPGYYGYGAPVVVAPAVSYAAPVQVQTQPVAQASTSPDPIFYPRNNQSVAQIESDRQSCNRWATTQPRAMNDASIFHRATLACMEGRGYSVS